MKHFFDSPMFNVGLCLLGGFFLLSLSMLPAQYHLTEQAKQSITQGK